MNIEPTKVTDSQRLDKIIELLEKIDWKLWEIYQKKVGTDESEPSPIAQKVIKK